MSDQKREQEKKEVREFWITKTMITKNEKVVYDYSINNEFPHEYTPKMASDEYHHGDEAIHVIEKSAYDELLKDAQGLVEALQNACAYTEHLKFAGYGTGACDSWLEALKAWEGREK